MNILLWIALGLLAGGLASRLLDDTISDTLMDIALGVTGSLFSGYLLYMFGTHQNGVDIFQVFTILLSAVVFIWIRNSIRARI